MDYSHIMPPATGRSSLASTCRTEPSHLSSSLMNIDRFTRFCAQKCARATFYSFCMSVPTLSAVVAFFSAIADCIFLINLTSSLFPPNLLLTVSCNQIPVSNAASTDWHWKISGAMLPPNVANVASVSKYFQIYKGEYGNIF